MKKLLLLLLTIIATITLAACQSDSNVLKVGMDLRYPPFETRDSKNKPEGISVDIAYAFGEYLDKKIKIVAMDFANLIIALQNGQIDVVVASMSITEERATKVDFSIPYFNFHIISLLNKDFALANNLTEESKIDDLLALEGVSYAGATGQVSTSIPKSYGLNVKEYSNPSIATEEVAAGTHDVYLMSASPIVGAHKTHRDKTIVMWDPIDSSPIAMAFKKGSPLKEEANSFISSFSDEGGLYDILRNKWDEVILSELERAGLDFYIEK